MMRGQPSMSAVKHLQEAGIRPDHAIVSYLTHIGLISDIAFVEFKPDTVELAGWCDKFKSEVTFGDNKIGPIDGDQLDVMKASLIATHKSITKPPSSNQTFRSKDWETPTVLQQNQLFHRLTTQASSDDGRPPPRSSNVDDDTWRRWEDNNKQFPP